MGLSKRSLLFLKARAEIARNYYRPYAKTYVPTTAG
jgi:hypothetical protein